VSHGFSVIDVATDKVRDVASPYGASATAVGFAPEGDVAVALYAPWDKGRFAVYDTKTWQVVRMFADDRGIFPSKMALSPDNTHLAVTKGVGIIQLWNYRTGTLLREFKAHIGWILSFDFSHEGTFLAVTSSGKVTKSTAQQKVPVREFDENALTVWSVKNGDLIASKYPQVENGKWVDTLAFSRATERLAVRTKGGVTVFRDAQLNIEQEIITNHIWVTSIKFSPLSDYLAVSGSDRKGFYVPISTMIFFNNARSD